MKSTLRQRGPNIGTTRGVAYLRPDQWAAIDQFARANSNSCSVPLEPDTHNALRTIVDRGLADVVFSLDRLNHDNGEEIRHTAEQAGMSTTQLCLALLNLAVGDGMLIGFVEDTKKGKKR